MKTAVLIVRPAIHPGKILADELAELMPTTVPVSDLRNKHREVFGMLKDGPILLAVRSCGEAVLVDVEQWNNLIRRLAKFEQQQTMVGIFDEMRNSDLPSYTRAELEAVLDAPTT